MGGQGYGNDSYGSGGGGGAYDSQNRPGGGYGGGGDQFQEGRRPGHFFGGDFDPKQAAQHAQQHGGGDSNMFSSAMSFLSGGQAQHNLPDVDESHLMGSHQALYGGGQGSSGSHTSDTLGAGAAMQALKVRLAKL